MQTPEDHSPTAPPTLTGTAGNTFRLNIRFSGLCLFVPEPADRWHPEAGLAAVHVLMMNAGDDTPTHGLSRPAPAVHHGGDRGAHPDVPGPYDVHPKHYSMLYVDEGHLRSGASLTGRLVGIPLRDAVLRLPETAGVMPRPHPLLAQAVPLHEISSAEALPRVWIGRRPGRQVAARVELTSGHMVPPTPYAVAGWMIRHPDGMLEGPMSIATHVEWEMPRVDGSDLTVTLRDLDEGAQVVRRMTLYPRDGKLTLYVYCLPVYELPGAAPSPPPGQGEPATHFTEFFSLFPDATAPELQFAGTAMSETSVCTAAQVQLAQG